MDFTLCEPISTRPVGFDDNLALERVVELLGESHWDEALTDLANLPLDDFVRQMIVRALQGINDNRRTIETIREPTTNEEAVLLGGAILEDGTDSDFQQFMSIRYIVENTDSSVSDIVARLKRKCSR